MTSSLAPTDAYPDFKNLTSTYPGLTQEMLDYEIQVIRAHPSYPWLVPLQPRPPMDC